MLAFQIDKYTDEVVEISFFTTNNYFIQFNIPDYTICPLFSKTT